MEKTLFTFEEWAEYFEISEKNPLTTYCYERDLRIAEVMVNEGLEGVINLLRKHPYQMGDLASLIIYIYDFLKAKGLV